MSCQATELVATASSIADSPGGGHGAPAGSPDVAGTTDTRDGSTPAVRRRPLRVGGVPEHFNLPWHIAIERGLFAKHGVDVEWVTQVGRDSCAQGGMGGISWYSASTYSAHAMRVLPG